MRDAVVYVHEVDKLEDELQTCRTYCGLYDLRIVECTVGDRAHAIAEARRRGAVLVTTTVTNLGDTVQAVAKAAAVVDVVSIREGIDSTTAMGRLVMNVLATVHQYYIEKDLCPDEARALELIAKLRASGLSLRTIAAELKARGVAITEQETDHENQ